MGRQDSRFIVFRRCRSAFSKQWMAFCFYHCDKAEASSEVMSRGRSSLRIGRQCREFAASIGKPALLPEESKAALHVLQVALDLTMLHSFVPSLYYSNFPRPPPPNLHHLSPESGLPLNRGTMSLAFAMREPALKGNFQGRPSFQHQGHLLRQIVPSRPRAWVLLTFRALRPFWTLNSSMPSGSPPASPQVPNCQLQALNLNGI